MGSRSKKTEAIRIVGLADSISRNRNTEHAMDRLAEICKLLGPGWGLRVYWSSAGWEVDIRSGYGLIPYYSVVENKLIAAIKKMAQKIYKDAEDGSIHVSLQD